MLLVDNDYTTIEFESSNNLLKAKAKQVSSSVPYTDEIWKTLNTELLEVVQKYQPRLMYLDSTMFDYVVSPSLQTWYAIEIARNIYKAGVEKIAVVMSPNFVVNLATEQLVEEIEDRKIVTAFFGNNQAALDWIMS